MARYTRYNEAFSQVLRSKRERLYSSRKAFSEATGISASYIKDLEVGDAIPTLVVFHRLADGLDLDPGEFIQDILRALALLNDNN